MIIFDRLEVVGRQGRKGRHSVVVEVESNRCVVVAVLERRVVGVEVDMLADPPPLVDMQLSPHDDNNPYSI